MTFKGRDIMGKHSIEMYDGKVWGFEVSKYGLENGYLDYLTLSKMVGACIQNNTIREETLGDWEMVTGEFKNAIVSDYIISRNGYQVLRDYTDEVVFYNETLDIYVWAIDHYGTSWDYVLTDVELINGDDEE